MLKKLLKLNNVQALSKKEQKQIAGGDNRYTVCEREGQSCSYTEVDPFFGAITHKGQCYRYHYELVCVPY